MSESENGLREWRNLLIKDIGRLHDKVDGLEEKVDGLVNFKNKVIGYAIGSGVASGAGVAGLLKIFKFLG